MNKKIIRRLSLGILSFLLIFINSNTIIQADESNTNTLQTQEKSNTTVFIDDWSWIEPDTRLKQEELTEDEKKDKTEEQLREIETEKPWKLTIEDIDPKDPLTKDEIAEFLPKAVNANTNLGEQKVILEWNLDALSDENTVGEFKLEANPKDDVYKLNETSKKFEINLILKELENNRLWQWTEETNSLQEQEDGSWLLKVNQDSITKEELSDLLPKTIQTKDESISELTWSLETLDEVITKGQYPLESNEITYGEENFKICVIVEVGQTSTEITEWSFVDEYEAIVWSEENNRYELNLPNVTEENPLTKEALIELLPKEIKTIINDVEQVLPISWNLEELEDTLKDKEYTLNATLTDEQYILSEDSKELSLYLVLSNNVNTLQDTTYGAYSNHILDTGVSPSNTKIDLYDYWFYDSYTQRFDVDSIKTNGYGINGHNNALKFVTFEPLWNQNKCNQSSTSSYVTPNIVSKTLDSATGLPTFGATIAEDNELKHLANQPLEVVFGKQNDKVGKQVFENVQNLLQIDQDGYYYYDAKKNFAEFNEGTNRFNLYDTPGVDTDGFGGQFFPFNQAGEIFDEVGGKLQNSQNLYTETEKPIYMQQFIHHFHGLTMTTDFTQLDGGRNKGEDVIYSFSGDDDVWVFIDGVLVGDLGGMHAPVELTINFQTGKVDVIGRIQGADGKTPTNVSTTLYDCFKNANALDRTTFNGDTFADGTNHTLSFFYLERGNAVANMSLKYNLVPTAPTSTIQKVDDEGSAISDVEFNLIPTDENYSNEEYSIFSGKTDGNGNIQLVNENGKPITLSDLKKISNNYILREVNTPDGYRKGQDVHLTFDTGNSTPNWKVDNQWESGAYSQTLANYEVYSLSSSVKETLSKGGYFIPTIKKGSEYYYQDTEENWQKGTLTDVLNNEPKKLTKNEETGFYVGSIELPLNYSSDYELSVVLIDSSGNLKEDKIPYSEILSSNLVLANIRNQFQVSKVDADDKPIQGVVFGLYETELTEGDPYDTATTNENGMITFGLDGTSDIKKPLVTGKTYYLKELSTPDGYILEERVTDVVISSDGIYANAGTAQDNVNIKLGLGKIIETMKPFASDNIIDGTLYNVIAAAKIANDPSNWDKPITTTKEKHFKYTENGYKLSYDTLTYDYISITYAYGKLQTKQCDWNDHDDRQNKKDAPKQDLDITDLDSLFTGQVIVEVRNDRVPKLTLEKIVTGENVEQDVFDFTIDFASLSQGAEIKGILNSGSGSEFIIYNGVSFKLGDKQSVTFDIPENDAFTITEAEGDYTTQYYVKGNESEKKDGLVYENTKGISKNKNLHVIFENSFNLTGFSFTKTDDEGNALSGASFVLYEKTCDDNHTTDLLEIDESGNLKNSSQENCWKLSKKITSDQSGIINFNKLNGDREYRLIEYDSPNEYLLPSGQWSLTFDKTSSNEYQSNIKQVGNPPAFKTNSNKEGLTLPNYKMGTVPITGSMGIGIFMAVGGPLMLIGGMLHNQKKKRK